MDNDRAIESDIAPAPIEPCEFQVPAPALPRSARLSINRCNLPAWILGSLAYQRHPVRLTIDGVRDFHGDLCRRLDPIEDHRARASVSSIT